MSIKTINLLILFVFFLISCENKINNREVLEPDEDAVSDSEQIDDSDKEKEAVFDLKVEVNEKNVLSCRLTFSTAGEKKTFVKYYSATHSGYKINEDSAKTDHYFFLWGMRENLDYKIEIYSDEEEPELLATSEFHSGFIPQSIYPVNLVTNEKENVQPGFLLMTQNTTNNWTQYPIMFMVDVDGFVVWYYEHDYIGGALLCDAKYHEKTRTVFVGVQKDLSMSEIPFEEGFEIDLEGNIVWKSQSIASHSYTENGWHHQYTLLDDDTILFIQAQFQGMMLTDRILNVDRNYNELWNWGYLDSLDEFKLPECADSTTEWCDWTHTNAVTMFKDTGEIYLNSLRLGFYKMDLNTKKVLWKLAKDGNFTMLSQHEYPWTDRAHSPEFYDSSKKRILFFDNGINERPFSRIIEYEINEDDMTAEITFEYDGINDGRGWYAEQGWGDADYLENGNILVAKGLVRPPDNSSVFEITRDGKVVWELYNYQDEDFMVVIYKVDKFMPQLEFIK